MVNKLSKKERLEIGKGELKWLFGQYSGREGERQNANYSVTHSTTEPYRILGWSCFGQLFNNTSNANTTLSHLSLGAGKARPDKYHKIDKESAVRYYDWLINHSPWKEAYLTKDPEEVFDLGTVYDTDLPANFIISAASALREVWEKNSMIKGRLALVEEGFTHEAAVFISALIYCSKGWKDGFKFNYRCWDGHSPFYYTNTTYDGMINFFKGEYKKPIGSMYHTTRFAGAKGGINNLYNEPGSLTKCFSAGILASEFVQTTTKKDTWSGYYNFCEVSKDNMDGFRNWINNLGKKK